MIRKKSKYKKPRKLYDKNRIEEENRLLAAYGLKNKREIWKADSKISLLRRRAKELITTDDKMQNRFIEKLKKIGFDVKDIPSVLALKKEDLLNRRLQTILLKKHNIKNPKEARQLIVHKHVMINDEIVNVPSYIVPKDLEDKITIISCGEKPQGDKNDK
ncbi:MAG: 30S ribosomal protein S4 [Candidatus Pacearchaeota archaeon]